MISVLIFFVVVIFILVAIRPSEIVSRWHHFFDEAQYSSEEFYRVMTESIEKRKIPNSKSWRIKFFESTIISAQREYLRVSNVVYLFDICAAPYATGFFVSWWLRESKSLAELAFERIFRANVRKTYYQMDSQTMFQDAVHQAVLESIEAMTSTKGVRGLTELERQITFNPKLTFQVKPPQ